MGKKRIIQKSDLTTEEGKAAAVRGLPKKKISEGVVHVQSTYNNTLITVSDTAGNVILSSSAGAMGFRGSKKGTPYAATKVAEILGERAKAMGVKELSVLVKGVGSGRESVIRSFAAQGFDINTIRDITPVPHNGPKPPKPRRV